MIDPSELGAGNQSASDPQTDSSDPGITGATFGSTCDPARHPNYGNKALNTHLASDDCADVICDRYRFNDAVLSWGGAIIQYQNERSGQDASAKANRWSHTLHRRARKKCGILHRADRVIRPEMDAPTLSFLTFAGQYNPSRCNEFAYIIDYTIEIAQAVNTSMNTHRYQIRSEYSTEYALIMGGTEAGVPHFHMVGWHDGPVDRERFETVIERFVEECDVATEAQNPPTEAVKLDPDPSTGLEEYPGDPPGQPVHPFARDSANQLPHLGRVDDDLDAFEGMTQGELRISAVADALPSSVSTWRTSGGVPSINSLSD